jgi:hypothetical protein
MSGPRSPWSGTFRLLDRPIRLAGRSGLKEGAAEAAEWWPETVGVRRPATINSAFPIESSLFSQPKRSDVGSGVHDRLIRESRWIPVGGSDRSIHG